MIVCHERGSFSLNPKNTKIRREQHHAFPVVRRGVFRESAAENPRSRRENADPAGQASPGTGNRRPGGLFQAEGLRRCEDRQNIMKRLRNDRFVKLLLQKFRPRRHGGTGTHLQMVLFRHIGGDETPAIHMLSHTEGKQQCECNAEKQPDSGLSERFDRTGTHILLYHKTDRISNTSSRQRPMPTLFPQEPPPPLPSMPPASGR